jgi:hypothetical protein
MHREQGTVIFLAMLLTLVLTGLLVLQVERTSTEIALVGNARFAKIGYFLADSGLTATLAKAAVDPQSFLAFAEAHLEDGNPKITLTDLGMDIYGTDYSDIFGPEGYALGIVNFETILTDQTDTNRIPGFSANGTCFKRYVWTTTGQYGLGDEGSGAGVVNNAFRVTIKKARSIGFLGPVSCPL